LRVLHLATTLQGGAGIGARRYHQALLRAGVDSRFLVADLDGDPESTKIAKVKRRYPRGWERLVKATGLFPTAEKRMARRVAEADQAASKASYELFSLPFSSYPVEEHPWIREADEIHIHWVAGFLDWLRFFRSVNRPMVVVLHDQQNYLGGFHYERDAGRNPQLRQLEEEIREIKKQTLKGKCARVIANSEWNAQAARASGFFDEGTPIECVYYPLDTQVFAPRPRESAKQALGIRSTDKVVGFACADLANERKGFAELVQALAGLPAEVRSGMTLLSFGKEPSAATRHEVGCRWVHLGVLDSETTQVAAYSAMDVFVAPSKAEAFGLSALEARACGCRLVVTSVGGLPEASGKDAFQVSAGSINEFQEGIQKALKSGSSPEGVAKEIEERHSLELVGQKYKPKGECYL
jgi:glycosyltransferase involved in cell wall biosynthesis